MKTPQSFYILIDLEKALRLWRNSGKRNTFGNYCLTLRSLGYRLIMALVVLGMASGVAMAGTKTESQIMWRSEKSQNETLDEFTLKMMKHELLVIDTKIIAQMESSGNPFAKNGNHWGLCQIGRAVLHDYNLKHSTFWEPVDLFNGVINLRVAEWYLNKEIPRLLKHYKIKDTIENRLTAWRYGIKSVKRGNMATKYTARYRKGLL